MPAKKKILEGYTYKDLFDTQDALETGTQSSVAVPITGQAIDKSTFGGYSNPRIEVRDTAATKETLGSILGQTDAISAFKKRKAEQLRTSQQGFGTSQSILGGGAF